MVIGSVASRSAQRPGHVRVLACADMTDFGIQYRKFPEIGETGVLARILANASASSRSPDGALIPAQSLNSQDVSVSFLHVIRTGG